MFVKKVNAKSSRQAMPPDKLAFLQERGRVSVLGARASHVTYCLRFRLAQRYLQGVNQRALANRNRTNSRGECRRPPDHDA